MLLIQAQAQPPINLFIRSLFMHFVDIVSFSFFLSFIHSCDDFFFLHYEWFLFVSICLFGSRNGIHTPLAHCLLPSRTDKWYSSVLHTKPRASHSSWWYGIQNGLIIINRMQINTNHLNIRIDFSDEHHFGDLSSNSIILFNVIFFLLLLIN